MEMMVYLASPLGFSPEMQPYREKIKSRLNELRCSVFDPWDQMETAPELQKAFLLTSYEERAAALAAVAAEIGLINEKGIRSADILLAVLDGAEVDSGTASELGFASALGKRCYGLRTDIRDCGDFMGIPVNLQVLHFIERTGGRLFRSVADLTF